MSTADNNDETSRHSGQWLDADDDVESASEYEIPADQQAQIADLQLVDALLSNVSPRAKEEKEARIQRVIEEIHQVEPSTRTGPRFVPLKSLIAIAASLMIACGLFWATFTRESRAEVVLREIGQVALENIDRIYQVRRETSSPAEDRTIEGKLYLRGREGFLLRWGDVVLGRDGDQYWLVPKRKSEKVVLADSFEWIVAESGQQAGELEMLKHMSSSSRRVPIMQLSASVDLMKDGYGIALSREDYHGRSVDVIVGELREKSRNFPDEITLWADADSRIIQRFSFRWESGHTIVFERMPAEEVPADWYKHETHHDDQRGVRRVTETTVSTALLGEAW